MYSRFHKTSLVSDISFFIFGRQKYEILRFRKFRRFRRFRRFRKIRKIIAGKIFKCLILSFFQFYFRFFAEAVVKKCIFAA